MAFNANYMQPVTQKLNVIYCTSFSILNSCTTKLYFYNCWQVKMRPGEQSATEGYYPSLGYDNESPECSEMLDRLAGECMMKAMLN